MKSIARLIGLRVLSLFPGRCDLLWNCPHYNTYSQVCNKYSGKKIDFDLHGEEYRTCRAELGEKMNSKKVSGIFKPSCNLASECGNYSGEKLSAACHGNENSYTGCFAQK